MRTARSILCFAALGVSALACAPSAGAASAWWHLTTAVSPAHLATGAASLEVQHLTVSGNASEPFVLADISAEEVHEIIEGKREPKGFALFTVGEEADGIREGLEEIYGTGNVEVSGGAGAQTGSEPYVVTFVGARAYRPLPAMNTELNQLVGFGGRVDVSQTSEGNNSGELLITAINLGDASADGASRPVTIVDTLPAGLEALGVSGKSLGRGGPPPASGACAIQTPRSVRCEFSEVVAPFHAVQADIVVGSDQQRRSGEALENEASVLGGGASTVSASRLLQFGGETAFGVEDDELAVENEGGTPDTQAGSHPFQLTSTLQLNQAAGSELPAGLVKDVSVKLPPGLVGNPTPIPECRLARFDSVDTSSKEAEVNCPVDSQVGVATVMVNRLVAGASSKLFRVIVPVFNIEPAVGEPARFGFFVPEGNVPVLLDTSVRSGHDYGVTVTAGNVAQAVAVISSEVTFWGVPGAAEHDVSRGYACLSDPEGAECTHPTEQHSPALLSLPTSCTGPLTSSVEVDSWADPGRFESTPSAPMPALDGCNRLPFSPSIQVTPDGAAASTPTGLTVDVHVPQEESQNPAGLAESDPKDITVSLPEGVAVNPSGADGLEACSESLVGFTGFVEVNGASTAQFTPSPSPYDGSANTLQPGVNFCSDASKIGTAVVRTPLLPHPIEGAVYLATQDTNPFGSLIAMYLVAEDPHSGVQVKLAGQVHLTASGGIVTTFENSPQAPFEDAELHFFGGDRAPLATPDRCGAYTTTANFAPWSGNPPVGADSAFNITSGPNGAPCLGASLPFSPTLTAGTTSIQAGGFSPFTMTMSRADGNQNLSAIKLHMPPGISGLLSSVKLCDEADANAGTCDPQSQIGETIVSVGLGGNPFSVKGGKVFITEGYEGAPYGLSIVNPAKAGPFDLGQVVVRAKIQVDPITAQLTVTSDSTGPYKIPTILDGIPLQIQHINVTINRPGFTFNPTNCNPMSITSDLSSSEGATSELSVPLQVTNCATLAFKPRFSVSTNGKTSRQNGASLHVKLTYPQTPFGSQANIRSVNVSLPKQLPSRLTTLQKACVAKTFAANPSSCPRESIVGRAVVHTQILSVPLEGPAYFVSHGGEEFPNLIIVLQGSGVTIQLVGDTFIKNGVTSSTFRSAPDVPFESFELTLPQGKFSALGANTSLCTVKGGLKMPTMLTAQNGMTLKQNAAVRATGCAKAHKKPKHARRHGRRKK